MTDKVADWQPVWGDSQPTPKPFRAPKKKMAHMLGEHDPINPRLTGPGHACPIAGLRLTAWIRATAAFLGSACDWSGETTSVATVAPASTTPSPISATSESRFASSRQTCFPKSPWWDWTPPSKVAP